MKQLKKTNSNAFPILNNDRITLRKILNSDINEIIEISYYDAVQATTLQQAIDMNAKINKDYDEGNTIHWGIVDNLTNKIVGTCGYYRGFANDEGELGCVLLPQYRGQGFMTHAILLAIDFGIKNIGLRRIWAVTSQQNQQAIKLLETIKFKKCRMVDFNDVEFELTPKS